MSPNFDKDRKGYAPKAIVIHRSEGSFESSFAWCNDPKSKVSYHYLINKSGEVFELVYPKDTAWHAGLAVKATWPLIKQGINTNLYTLGIALSGLASTKPTIRQIISCGQLVKKLCSIYKIQLDSFHIIPHNSIRSDKICPGVNVSVGDIIYLAGLED